MKRNIYLSLQIFLLGFSEQHRGAASDLSSWCFTRPKAATVAFL